MVSTVENLIAAKVKIGDALHHRIQNRYAELH